MTQPASVDTAVPMISPEGVADMLQPVSSLEAMLQFVPITLPPPLTVIVPSFAMRQAGLEADTTSAAALADWLPIGTPRKPMPPTAEKKLRRGTVALATHCVLEAPFTVTVLVESVRVPDGT